MKNKFYTSLLWIGLAFATTTSYAKPAHLKHASVSAKCVKMTARHAAGRKKYSINASNKRERTKLRSILSTRKVDRRSPTTSTINAFLAQKNQGDSFLEPTENHDRIHSFIAAHNKNDLIENSANYSDETPRHITSVHGTINSSLSLEDKEQAYQII